MLLKYFPYTGLETRDNGVLSWMDLHKHCHKIPGGTDLSGNTCFTLHTEKDYGSKLLHENLNKIPENKS